MLQHVHYSCTDHIIEITYLQLTNKYFASVLYSITLSIGCMVAPLHPVFNVIWFLIVSITTNVYNKKGNGNKYYQ